MAVQLRRMDMGGSSWHDVSTGEHYATTDEAITRINQLADDARQQGGEIYITDDTALAIHYGLSSVLFYIDTI